MNDLDAPKERVEASPEHFALISAEGDALCAAAAVLLRHPGARIVVAHPANLLRLLIQMKAKHGQVGQGAASGKSRRAGVSPAKSCGSRLPARRGNPST